MSAPAFTLSTHANVRAQQRGVRRDVLDLLLLHADLSLDAGSGTTALRISDRHARAIVADGADPAVVGLAKSLVALVADGVVITVFHQSRARTAAGHSRRRMCRCVRGDTR